MGENLFGVVPGVVAAAGETAVVVYCAGTGVQHHRLSVDEGRRMRVHGFLCLVKSTRKFWVGPCQLCQ